MTTANTENIVDMEIEIDDDLYEEVKLAAKQQGISIEDYIKQALEDYLVYLEKQNETT